MQHVFISYNRKDKQIAERLAGILKQHGFEIWWDIDSLLPGAVWGDELDIAIKQAFAVVVLLTANSIQSNWVTYEWAYASALEVSVIPLEVEEVRVTEIHKKLEKYNILTCVNLDTEGVSRLIFRLHSLGDLFHAVKNTPNRDILAEGIDQLHKKAEINPELIPLLIEGLTHYDDDVVEACASVLGELRVTQALDPLLYILNHPDTVTRSRIVESIGMIGAGSERIDQLAQRLMPSLYDIQFIVRQSGAKALGLLKSRIATLELLEIIHDKELMVRMNVITALGQISDPQAVSQLVECLKDDTIVLGTPVRNGTGARD